MLDKVIGVVLTGIGILALIALIVAAIVNVVLLLNQ